MVVEHFEGVYDSEDVSGLIKCLQAIPKQENDDMNNELFKEVIDSMIKYAIQSSGKLKTP